MGRRRRKVVKVIKRGLPKVFLCPKCGSQSVSVRVRRPEAKAAVTCGSCGLSAEVDAGLREQPVDLYCRFTDKFYGGAIG